MSASSHDQPKKSSSVLDKLGQRFTTIKEDIADNLERRKQSYNNVNSNQVHFTTRTHASEDSLVIEKKPPSPPELRQRQISSDDNSLAERTLNITQLTASLRKKASNESSHSMLASTSVQDIFSSESSEQAKEMIISGLRDDFHHLRHRAASESSIEEPVTPRLSPVKPTSETSSQQSTALLAGPRFRSHTILSNGSFKRDTIYPVSGTVAVVSLVLALWQPISTLLSGFIIGFLFAAGLAYISLRVYLSARANETVTHEWLTFPDLESMLQEKVVKPARQPSPPTCVEVVFGRYDADRDEEFIRYPAVIRLDNYRLIIQLPTKIKSEERKEIKFVGYREYLVKESNLILVPEVTLCRIKYWLNEYPIVIDNLQILDKQIVNKQNFEKLKFDADDFFLNSHTTLSLFFETGPDKEEWFHTLSLALRKGKDEVERTNRLLKTAPAMQTSTSLPALHSMDSSLHAGQTRTNTFHLDERAHARSTESPSDSPTTDRSHANETDVLSDKDTASAKKKFRKQEEHLQQILDSPDCLNEAALTLNFLTRRLFCDVFEETLFKDLLKEKIQLKLKEIALTVLDDLHVENIDLGNTFPTILKVEPMQWNPKGIWFKLFVVYRGSFKITIKTRIVLQRLLNYNPISDQPLCAQQHHRDDERIDDEDTLQRQKLLAKEPEVAESVASRKLGTLLTKVASNKHFQRFAALKPVAGVIEKLSNAEVGVNVELMNFSGIMTINIPPPPSDRIWIGFSEMPDLNLKVTPVFGESKYSYTLIHDFLEARIQDEIRRLLVLPSMDDQLLPFIRDWVIDMIGEIASKGSTGEPSQLHTSISEELIES